MLNKDEIKNTDKDNKEILKIGITGSIGSGKSTVSKILRDEGFDVIDADVVAKEVFTSDAIQKYLLRSYGESILTEKVIDRRKLADIVFSDKEKLQDYERLIFPLITDSILKKYEELKKAGKKIVFLEAALLFESADKRLYDKSIVVTADEKLLMERVMKRDGLISDKVKDRLKNQMSQHDKIKLADYVITNDGDISHLKDESLKLTKKIMKEF